MRRAWRMRGHSALSFQQSRMRVSYRAVDGSASAVIRQNRADSAAVYLVA